MYIDIYIYIYICIYRCTYSLLVSYVQYMHVHTYIMLSSSNLMPVACCDVSASTCTLSEHIEQILIKIYPK